MLDFYVERGKLWERLEKHKCVQRYKRPNDDKIYNIFLVDGLIKLECRTLANQIMTIDSFLYLWLERIEPYNN